MFNIGPQELLLIVVIALVVVGPKKLPELGRTLGKGLREVRKAQDEVRRTVKESIAEEERPTFRNVPARASEDVSEAAPGPGRDPDASEPEADPAAASDVQEISRTLGQSLSELRRAREDIRRSLRVDPIGSTSPSRKPTRKPVTPPAAPADAPEPSSEPPEE